MPDQLVPDERIVTTEVFEGVPDVGGDPTLNLVTFADLGDRTRLELLVKTPAKEIRDAIMDSGMEVGMQEQMDLLEQPASSLRCPILCVSACESAFKQAGSGRSVDGEHDRSVPRGDGRERDDRRTGAERLRRG